MTFDVELIRRCIREFDFDKLFIEGLGWNRHRARPLELDIDGQVYSLSTVAEKSGMTIYNYNQTSGDFPDYSTMRKIERKVEKTVHEHIIIYTDKSREFQAWQWVKRETGKPTACRIHRYYRNQSGESLIQKLQYLGISLQEEESITITQVAGRARRAFDIEKVTKRFYDRYKKEHTAFSKFIKGIEQQEDHDWYASVMLDRLMFIYFLQKKGFLDNNPDYLRNKLNQSKGKDNFYSKFLRPLFFEGFAKEEKDRTPEINKLLGKIPYLNGGIFLPHHLEREYKNINIPDTAFEKLFAFFDQYQWHLDDRPLRSDKEINPDVLGYIFEKYVNQKQMGAYYTKEDITEYISKNTIIPFLFDAAEKECKVAFKEGGFLWNLPRENPDRYIYNAIKHGIKADIHQRPVKDHESPLPLPHEIEIGINDVSKRINWNKSAPAEYALPTEIWREVVARRQRYEKIRGKLESGEVNSINDFITYNLDIGQFALDVIENCEGPELLRAFYHAIEKVTILDPTCGSGAFLFAAMNILEPLYEACLDRMQGFLDDLERSGEKHRPEKFKDFKEVLERMEKHPNRRYFIYKTIILNNLYGVDIMEEATEIAKLRLFLKLAALIEKPEQIEPLPDIDFNIRAGNTLVGFTSYEEVKAAITSKLDFDNSMAKIEEKAEDIDRLFQLFHKMQTEQGVSLGDFAEAKLNLGIKLKDLADELNVYLAKEYGINPNKKQENEKWRKTHFPFHWFIEFYGIMKKGGFDVIIGNPPYVAYSKVNDTYKIKNYDTLNCGNLYAYILERSLKLLKKGTFLGMIVPVSSVSGEAYKPLMRIFLKRKSWMSSFSNRPAKLFRGVEQRLTIVIAENSCDNQVLVSPYQHWYEQEREYLFFGITYIPTTIWHRTNMPVKSGNKNAESIFRKLLKYKAQPLILLSGKGRSSAWFHDGPTYWVRALSFQPNPSTRSERSNHYHRLQAQTRQDALVISGILSSSLFYFFFKMISNCRDLGHNEWSGFPIGELAGSTISTISSLSNNLNQLLKKTAVKCSRSYPSGRVFYKEYYPAKCKQTIDEIDSILAGHYDLTDEELDYIINYDIKYRMGREGMEEDEGAEE